jgi:hypothetical protein
MWKVLLYSQRPDAVILCLLVDYYVTATDSQRVCVIYIIRGTIPFLFYDYLL